MTTATVFSCWQDACNANLFTRTAWRRAFRRGIKPGASGIPARIGRDDAGKTYELYSEDQTSKMSPRVWSRNYLLDLFVGFPDRCKITTPDQRILELHSYDLHGSVRRAVEQGFSYRRCRDGIHLGYRKAQGFHVYGGDDTRFFVIDLDLHHPTREGIEVHLELLRQLEGQMPELLNRVQAATAFHQYWLHPSGIQIWVVLKRRWFWHTIHDLARRFLLSLGEELNQRLISAGLPSLDQIEIQPSPTHTISMAGFYGKEIFTDHVLSPIDGRCDVVGLADHIYYRKPPGSVLKRYQSLLEATAIEGEHASPVILPGRQHRPSHDSEGYVQALFGKAYNGVTTPDVLFTEYLAPLAQFLYFRDLRTDPDRNRKTKEILFDWVLKKHNNLVTRIRDGNHHLLGVQISRLVDRLEIKTGGNLKDWFAQIQLRDVQHPEHYKSLIDCMRTSTTEYRPFLLTNWKCQQKAQKSRSTNKLRTHTKNILPGSIDQRLSNTTLRTAKTRNRLKRFAQGLLPLLAPSAKSLSESDINKLLGLVSRQGALPYKKELVRLGLIKPHWDWKIVRGRRCSSYELTDWALGQFTGHEAHVAS